MSDRHPSQAGPSAKGESERKELGKREAAVARRTAEAKATIPHCYLRRTVEVAAGESDDVRSARLIAAAAASLAEHRALNAAYRDGAVERYSRVNIGFTVETGEGALVPTLFDADKMTVDEIIERLDVLGERALGGELTAPELSGGTFTVSALAEGADSLLPIVSPGQVAHLACGRPRPAALASGAELRAATVVELGLSCDQRALRPPKAAAFLTALAGRIEPEAL